MTQITKTNLTIKNYSCVGSVLNGITERVVMIDDISRLGMASRHMDYVNKDRDNKMRCDVALRDFGSEQRQGRVE